MGKVYLDTNIFVYSATPGSLYFETSLNLLKRVVELELETATSLGTIQEIVYVMDKLSQRNKGVKIARETTKIIRNILSIDASLLETYLKLIVKYSKLESRDCIHLAVCIKNKIKTIITEDKHFKRVKELECLTINEALKKYGESTRFN
jgi:predicted nucleic acid-binding protein